MNIEPLKLFLEEEMPAQQVAILLDEILFEYIECILLQQLSDNNEQGIHLKSPQFIYLLKRLRDVFYECKSPFFSV